jgi:hypothetical protein
MSCHVKDTSDGGLLWLCVDPILGITAEAEWIRQELRLLGHGETIKRRLEKRLAALRDGENNVR